jgi:hypothetical protein
VGGASGPRSFFLRVGFRVVCFVIGARAEKIEGTTFKHIPWNWRAAILSSPSSSIFSFPQHFQKSVQPIHYHYRLVVGAQPLDDAYSHYYNAQWTTSRCWRASAAFSQFLLLLPLAISSSHLQLTRPALRDLTAEGHNQIFIPYFPIQKSRSFYFFRPKTTNLMQLAAIGLVPCRAREPPKKKSYSLFSAHTSTSTLFLAAGLDCII